MDEERFDLVDAEGRPLGATKPRSAVHRDGDWHASLHLWLLLDDGRVILQRRGLEKETFPGLLDVSVAGHLRAGEGVVEALREADEELGVTVPLARTARLGRRRVRHVGARVRDFEVQTVLAARLAEGLDELRPAAPEVLAAVALAVGALRDLAAGRAARGEARGADGAVRAETIAPGELVPRPDGYYALVCDALEALAAGRPITPFDLG